MKSLIHIKDLALGDSYTIGQRVIEKLRWPNQLMREIEIESFEVANNDIIARTGWTTSNLLNAMYVEELGSEFAQQILT